jgi:glycosyltransferase involved in cell wall biosynthesis
MTNPLISFVIPLFNHLEQTKAMLQSLIASLPQNLDYEIIFYDDASSDGTQEWLRELDNPQIRCFYHAQNCGYAKTNNDAIAHAKGRYLALLNNDLLFESNWLGSMLETLENPQLNAGIVGNLQFRVDDKKLDHAGVTLTPRGQFHHLDVLPKDTSKAIPMDIVTGACMLLHKADFDAVFGFDETFVNGCEDVDLCLKIRAFGKQIYLEPRSQILHYVSLSRAPNSIQNEKNSQYLFTKWRKEIKLQLIKCWVNLLTSGKPAYEAYIDGELTSSFLSKPHLAAMTISEAVLLRQEAYWARELGTSPINSNWQSYIHASGFELI